MRFLTSTAGVITDAYNYEAFGILLDEWHAATATPNNYLYAGEQYDTDLGLYYLRARYMNPKTGSFWSMDSHEGSGYDPASLHKYTYVHNNPVNGVDPSGHDFTAIAVTIATTISQCQQGMYNAVVSVIGSALQATILGVQEGKTQDQILKEYLLEETGIQTALDVFNFTKDWLNSHIQDEETAAIIEYERWREEVFMYCMLATPPDQEGEFEIDFEIEEEPQCFLAGTPVLTEAGICPIQCVKLGDRVWSWNESTGTNGLGAVVSLVAHEKKELWVIQTATDRFHVTGEHPFYLDNIGWLEARNIQAGQEFVTLDGETVRVESVERLEGPFIVYNLEVEDGHTFYVGNGGVLTHNASYRKMARFFRVSRKYSGQFERAHLVPFKANIGVWGNKAREALKSLGLTTEIPENYLVMPKNLTAKKTLKGGKFQKMATHRGSGMHSEEFMKQLATDLEALATSVNGATDAAKQAAGRKFLQATGKQIRWGNYPGITVLQ